ncbi:helix-turn-helix domain-containing protein [Modestobacter sp. VKM Ac-2977]|uniref:PucR family transcriptional regulator n=1 Tax=Modestobacter sp. VKM Ac-2977 TaxID=3004131 RepID=UPI0022AA4BAC|nr:helix-turn-helix domain-containing protein [Modestobacter sp. VKM Ac-2977]MCZ2819908.1 helix-turn-helix domain-containing protein [Modestobacter sp. VKM Ac-2977]
MDAAATPEEALARIARAAAGEHGAPAGLLDGYLPAVLAVAGTGRRLSGAEEESCRRLGGEAARAGVSLPALVDLYMTASRRLWPELPDLLARVRLRPVRPAELVGIGEFVWRAADTALAALATGHLDAQHEVVRREEAYRREFVDDLFSGRPDVGSLVERAEPFGLSLTATHVVTVAGTDRPIDSGMHLAGAVEAAVRARTDGRGLLVAARDGRLICMLSSSATDGSGGGGIGPQELAEVVGRAVARLTHRSSWRVGVGRPHAGPRGVLRSYREALDALDLAARLELPEPVVHARDLLVYRVLLRDETAMADLVQTVLGPLVDARGGAEPLVRTLAAYFATGGNTAATARALHLSVRAVSYRIERVHTLTGHDATDPADHLPLLVAVTGARMLGWPRRRLVVD